MTHLQSNPCENLTTEIVTGDSCDPDFEIVWGKFEPI
jgi:hypothetical protein